MRLSRMTGNRFKESPSEAILKSHQFLLRGGYARQLSSGLYSLLPVSVRIIEKIKKIIREEMNALSGQEVLMPMVMPKDIWEQSGRYHTIGNEMVRFEDRNSMGLVLGMTHEEAVVSLAKSEAGSYRNYPFMLYQIQTKFRDELRSRGGLIRVREFTMKDAYSFHTSQEDLESYYEEAYKAYDRIFKRVGLRNFCAVQSDAGMMGGGISHEFMLVSKDGEDTLIVCDKCNYAANKEVASHHITGFKGEPSELKKVATPDAKTIEEVSDFLKVSKAQLCKAVVYKIPSSGKILLCLVKGDREINEIKVARAMGVSEEMMMAYDEDLQALGIVPGYATPIGLGDILKDKSKIELVVDTSIMESSNLVTGANEEGYHYTGFEPSRDLLEGDFKVFDISQVEEGDKCSLCQGNLNIVRGIEIGNIFQLGTKYTESMKMTYLDKNGKAQTPIMGCYGIGLGRLMASVMEESHDKYGPIWPMSIAPYQVHINALNYNKPEVKEFADKLYQDLQKEGVEVLLDDTNNKPGFQFADADLLGIPLRLVVSPKNLARGAIEWKLRDGSKKGECSLEEALAQVKTMISEQMKDLNSSL